MTRITAHMLALTTALVLCACFSGTFLAGQPCANDAECGPNLSCEDGRCGGAIATTSLPLTSTTSTTSTTGSSTAVMTSESDSGSSSTTAASCGLGRCQELDILIIIDDSPSMEDKNNTLFALTLGFANTVLPAFSEACSVHLGLVTTGEFAKNPEGCQGLGSLVRVDNDGELCAFVDGHPYATKADFAKPDTLACVASVGIEGSANERPFDALLSTLSTEVNTGCNDNFLRPDSFLLILLATDEDDGEPDDPQGHAGSDKLLPSTWYATILALRGGKEDNIYIAASVGDEDQNTTKCPWIPLGGTDGTGVSPAPYLRSFLNNFSAGHLSISSLCQEQPSPSNFAPVMEEILDEVLQICEAS